MIQQNAFNVNNYLPIDEKCTAWFGSDFIKEPDFQDTYLSCIILNLSYRAKLFKKAWKPKLNLKDPLDAVVADVIDYDISLINQMTDSNFSGRLLSAAAVAGQELKISRSFYSELLIAFEFGRIYSRWSYSEKSNPEKANPFEHYQPVIFIDPKFKNLPEVFRTELNSIFGPDDITGEDETINYTVSDLIYQIFDALNETLPPFEAQKTLLKMKYKNHDRATLYDILEALEDQYINDPHVTERSPADANTYYFYSPHDLLGAMLYLRELAPEHSDTREQLRVEMLNRNYAAIQNGGSFSVLREYIDPITNKENIALHNRSDFLSWFLNDLVKIQAPDKRVKAKNAFQEKIISRGELWLRSPHRRQYEGIVFAPGKDVPGHYNLFKGFAVDPKPGDWPLMESHIREVICNGDSKIFEWVICWLARICQDPGGDRPGTSIILSGPQGCGKGAFVTNFGRIFGQHFLHLQDSQQLAGRFNSHLKDALLVFADEMTWNAQNEAQVGLLKCLITEETRPVEAKGKDIYVVRNHASVIGASNSKRVVPAGMDERRFCVLDVSGKFSNDRNYFGSLFHQMDNGGIEAMLHDLLAVDISIVDLRTIPRTRGLLNQIFSNLESVQAFWLDQLYTGNIGSLNLTFRGETIGRWSSLNNEPSGWHLLTDLHDRYIDFCRKLKIPNPKIATVFSKELLQVCPGLKKKRNPIAGDKVQVLLFPPLEECRDAFSQKVKIPIEWEPER